MYMFFSSSYCGCFFRFRVNKIALPVRWLSEPSCHASLMQVLYIFYTDFTFQELESLVIFMSCVLDLNIHRFDFVLVRCGRQREVIAVYSS